MAATIYHNPACGTSRTVLALLRETGEEPTVIEYLKEPPTRDRLAELIAAMGAGPRHVLRAKGPAYEAFGQETAALTDDALIDLMAENPALINRPIVVTARGVRLCRPADVVLEILEKPGAKAPCPD